MQIVDILRTKEVSLAKLRFELGKRQMRRIGQRLFRSLAPRRVELPDQLGIALPSLRRADIFNAMPCPKPIRSTKCRQAALRADARACEHKYPVAGCNVDTRH